MLIAACGGMLAALVRAAAGEAEFCVWSVDGEVPGENGICMSLSEMLDAICFQPNVLF